VRRRAFITLIAGATVTRPFAALAQEPGRTYRLGGLTATPRNSPPTVAMLDELRRLGFIEGQNLTIVWRAYALHVDSIPETPAAVATPRPGPVVPTNPWRRSGPPMTTGSMGYSGGAATILPTPGSGRRKTPPEGPSTDGAP
jgi:hypothetical protein